MTREEVISKVRKLFELSHSPNENEAALAAAKARELLSRYNLSMADLPMEDIKSAIAPTETSVTVGKVLRNWVKGLLIHVSRGFDCEHLICRRGPSEPLLTFIGTGADAEVAVYTFHFLYRELNSLADKTLPRLKRENRGWSTAALRYAYLDGAVKRIGERFLEQTRAVKATEIHACKELVLAKEQIIMTYMADTFPGIRREYVKRRMVIMRAFEKGYLDAAAISLRPAVTDRDSDRFAAVP
jgi:hypothetical protein